LMAFGLPIREAWPYAVASGILHTGYNLFLARSYKFGDLSLVYPVARGTAPLLTLLGTQIFTHDVLSSTALIGIITLIIGILLIAFSESVLRVHRTTLMFALATSVFIGCYTIVDGLGGRVSGNTSSYVGLIYLFDATGMLIAAPLLRGRSIFAAMAGSWKSGALSAMMAGSTYWIVVWAMSQAPIAAVAALRETSILFALLFSAKLLKEKMTWQRLVGVGCIVVGAIALHG
ncbi:MAG: DMT family transporter, partial [Aestuariivirga sp.]